MSAWYSAGASSPIAYPERHPQSSSKASQKNDTTRAVLNMKDMNNKSNQLNSKINHCFGDFYKKLDTFADLS